MMAMYRKVVNADVVSSEMFPAITIFFHYFVLLNCNDGNAYLLQLYIVEVC